MGAAFGSFANVVIYRLPKGESVVRPPSFCRACGTPVKAWHNLPILGWFILRGRCAKCKAPFSFRYPAVEMLMASLFAVAAWRYEMSWTLVEALILIFGLVVVSFIDLDHMILPDKFTLPGIAIGLIGALVNPERSFVDAIFGVLLGGGFLWAVAYLYFLWRKRDGMGGGDIKLLAWIGAVLGWRSIPFVILVASIVGSLVGIALALLKPQSDAAASATDAEVNAAESEEATPIGAIPFGPFLSAAALIYLLCDGARLIQWYLDLHGMEV